jgi:hypothetical protein
MILKKNNFDNVDLYSIFAILLLVLQIIFGIKTNTTKVELGIVPTTYSKKTMKAFTFGDNEYYFRLKSLKVQNMGDTYGRYTALYKYDYKKLYDWIDSLDDLDSKSNYLASLSAYYFSQTQNKSDVRYVVNFLVKHSEENLKDKWWWMYQAASLSQYIVKDEELTISILNKLKNAPKEVLPIWLRQVVALFFSNNGQDCESLRILTEMEKEYVNLDKETDLEKKKKKESQLNYMRYFIKDVIDRLKAKKIDVNKCYFVR